VWLPSLARRQTLPRTGSWWWLGCHPGSQVLPKQHLGAPRPGWVTAPNKDGWPVAMAMAWSLSRAGHSHPSKHAFTASAWHASREGCTEATLQLMPAAADLLSQALLHTVETASPNRLRPCLVPHRTGPALQQGIFFRFDRTRRRHITPRGGGPRRREASANGSSTAPCTKPSRFRDTAFLSADPSRGAAAPL